GTGGPAGVANAFVLETIEYLRRCFAAPLTNRKFEGGSPVGLNLCDDPLEGTGHLRIARRHDERVRFYLCEKSVSLSEIDRRSCNDCPQLDARERRICAQNTICQLLNAGVKHRGRGVQFVPASVEDRSSGVRRLNGLRWLHPYLSTARMHPAEPGESDHLHCIGVCPLTPRGHADLAVRGRQ